MMSQSTKSPTLLEDTFSRAWELLRENWRTLLVPQIIIFVVAIIATGIIFGTSPIAHVDSVNAAEALHVMIAFVLGFFIFAAAAVVLVAVVNGMATRLWDTGTVSSADGFATLSRCWRSLLVLGVLAFLLLIPTFLLAIPTLGLAFFAYPILLLYITPAVVAGGDSGPRAIATSFRIVRAHFWPSVLLSVVLRTATSVIGGAAYLFGYLLILPGIGIMAINHALGIAVLAILSIVSTIAFLAAIGALFAFSSLVEVGAYRKLTAVPTPED
jgi:hypothetical protein